MYGKIFEDIFGSSLMVHGGDTVYVFIAMIVLSDGEGYIREHSAAFANRIGKDYDIVRQAIINLEKPDPESSTPDHDGRRIIPLREMTGSQENRGWFVVNKKKYKLLGSLEDQREQTRNRVRKHRAKALKDSVDVTRNGHVTVRNETVTAGNASNAIQIQDTNTNTNTDKETAQFIFELIRNLNPKQKEPDFDEWADDVRLMRERDKRTDEEIRSLFEWANNDGFWKTNILSPAKLRKQWDTLTIQRNHRGNNGTHQRVDTSAPGRVAAAIEQRRAKRKADKGS